MLSKCYLKYSIIVTFCQVFILANPIFSGFFLLFFLLNGGDRKGIIIILKIPCNIWVFLITKHSLFPLLIVGILPLKARIRYLAMCFASFFFLFALFLFRHKFFFRILLKRWHFFCQQNHKMLLKAFKPNSKYITRTKLHNQP